MNNSLVIPTMVPLAGEKGFVEPVFCPQAVLDWYACGSREKKKELMESGNVKSKEMTLKAKQHLSSLGWKFSYAYRKGRQPELRYISPKGKSFVSLRRACVDCMKDHLGLSPKDVTPRTGEMVKQDGLESEVLRNRKRRNPSDHQDVDDIKKVRKGKAPVVVAELKDDDLHGANPLDQDAADTQKLRKGNAPVAVAELRDDDLHGTNPSYQDVADTQKQRKKGKAPLVVAELRDNDSHKTNQKHQSKRARIIVKPSLLIDNNAVMPNTRVYYVGRKDQRRMKGGRISRDGISCDCCQKMFTLSGFEAHAGSTYHRPAANIVLEDGRSLLECQIQMLHKCNTLSPNTQERFRNCQFQYESDNICSICNHGGELLICDGCPSVFHLSCLGLKDLPEGNWLCSSCSCGLCCQSEFEGSVEEFTATMAQCDQCGWKYHIGCLKERGMVKPEDTKGKWFCTKKCEKIFIGLHEILGKSFPVGNTNLSWVILQSIKDDRGDPEELSDAKVRTECYSKLNVAVDVMHECFEPINETRRNSDLIEDLIFSKWSDLNRLNFQRFYTVLLQQCDELISVATVRIHDEKVAEVPLIATRTRHRGKGMCRLLMNELEKKVRELGVERLVLPAHATVLNMWTTYFGFSKMTDSERLKFFEYTFLGFPDTIMCQKLLTKMSSVNQCDESTDFDRYSINSEVIQEDQVEQSEIVEQLQQEEESNEWMECLQPDPENEDFWMDFLCSDVFDDDYMNNHGCNKKDT